ncbi:MAG: hypothetical protein JNM81_12650 [Rhodospirillaceae bacterium]|nr:hypothetical protein [Rhodospirillaceae bacterium]
MKSKRTEARVGLLPRRRKITIYAVSLGTLLTGAVWLIYHYFIRTVDKFGFESPDPAQKWWIIAHAVFGVCAVWLFGVLWPNHVKKSWRVKVRRLTGGVLFGLVLWLTLTGVALYYIGQDDWRSWTSILHWGAGLAAAVAFIWHLYFQRSVER